MFIEKLSRSYRYLLEQRDKELVPLSEELQFLQSFLFLVQERFGNKLQVTVQELKTEGRSLLPHSLMIVFDYLLATNSMSAAKPLCIDVAAGGASLNISYNRQPKDDNNTQPQEQLARLQQQYLLHGKELVITEKTEGKSTIQLPLF